MVPRPGEVVYVGRDASVQFSGEAAITVRVIRVDPRPTYEGWLWLYGYALDQSDHALEQRWIFVRAAGLVAVDVSRTGQPPWPLNAGPSMSASDRVRNRRPSG
jgi:hypothetical protein